MPHASFKILPGVDQNKTPALNEAAVSYSQFIRFIPDRTLGGLVQKLGGWTKYFPSSIGSIPRCLWAWEDTNSNSYLAVGAEGIAAGGGNTLVVIQNGGLTDITPQKTTVNVAVSVSTVSGSNEVTITDTGRNVSSYDVVDIQTQISVGGLILFGQYQCYNPGGGANTYKIYAMDVLGDPALATSTVANGGAVAQFATTSGSNVVSVTLNNHGYAAGDTFPVLIATTVGGITFYGNYIVTDITSANVFTIAGTTVASSTTTGYMNSGNAHYVYYRGVGALPTGTGWGVGGYGLGGYGTGTDPVITGGTPINAIDWTLDNWGETLIACPLNGPIYGWSPASGSPRANTIPEAPPVNQGMFVAMPQRQIIAYGSTFTGIVDPLLIRWASQDSPGDWTPSATSSAGDLRVSRGSRIIRALPTRQEILIWTDTHLYTLQFLGTADVFGLQEYADNISVASPRCMVSASNVVYWMGQDKFYAYTGRVETLPCTLRNHVFMNINFDQSDQIVCGTNEQWNEIWWFYPTADSDYNNAYVIYNHLEQIWYYGSIDRTAWLDTPLRHFPQAANTPVTSGVAGSGYVYSHENGVNDDVLPIDAYIQSSDFDIGEGDNFMLTRRIIPDVSFDGSTATTPEAAIQVRPRNFPGSTFSSDPADTQRVIETSVGVYTDQVFMRARARQMAFKIRSTALGVQWQLGAPRLDVRQDGSR